MGGTTLSALLSLVHEENRVSTRRSPRQGRRPLNDALISPNAQPSSALGTTERWARLSPKAHPPSLLPWLHNRSPDCRSHHGYGGLSAATAHTSVQTRDRSSKGNLRSLILLCILGVEWPKPMNPPRKFNDPPLNLFFSNTQENSVSLH